MTTITALNVRLAMDVSNFSEGANLAKSEVTRVSAIMRQSVPPAERYKQEVDLLNRAFSEAGKKSTQYANALDFLSKKYKQTESSAGSALTALKGMAAAYLTTQTISKSIDLASQVEDATIAFETLTGSAQEGALLFQQIRDFAARSPITFSGASQAAKTMMSFGIASEEIAKNLQMLSDITGGNNERFKMLALSFSQMSSAGRLMGQDLLQMINAGFNPLQQISKTTGESLVALKKRMEDGGISAEEVRQAFQDATGEGGMFHGMTERLSQTVSGKLNIALSDMEQKLAAAGKAMGPLVIQLLDSFQRLKPILDAIINLIDGISQGLGFALAAITDLINSVSTFSVDTTEMNKFLDMLEERERENAKAKEQAIDAEAQKRREAEHAAEMAAKKAAQDRAEAQAKALAAQQKAQQEAWEKQQKLIEKEKEARLKAIEEARRAQQRAAEEAEQNFQRALENARQAAMEYFRQQEEKQRQRREAVSAGTGAGIEVGSSEAAKFAADAVNRRIGASAVPTLPTPGEMEIAKKAEQMFFQQKEANWKMERQIAILDEILRESQQNGFRRLR